MPHEEAYCHLQIGLHAQAGDPARRRHLTRAAELFTAIGAAHGLTLASTALEGPSQADSG